MNTTAPPSMLDQRGEGNMGVVLAGSIGGFLGIIISLKVCYMKRWCCFAVSLKSGLSGQLKVPSKSEVLLTPALCYVINTQLKEHKD